jgi:hypothetical protein
MGLFEENPWLLVPFILVVVAGYDIAKWGVRSMLALPGERTERKN